MNSLKFILILSFFACGTWGNAQVTNDNEINAQVRAYRLTFGVDADTFSDEEIRFLIRAQGTANGSGNAASLIDTSPGANNGSCERKDEDVPDGGLSWNINNTILGPTLNTTNTGFDVHYMAWENDGGGDCTYDDGDQVPDQTRARYGFNLSGSGTTNQWVNSSLSRSSNGSKVEFQYVYRLAHGDGTSDPLTFGTLTSGRRYIHFNANRSNAPNADARMGYSNNFSGGSYNSSPDVMYSFTLSQAARLIVCFPTGTTNFDARAHLLSQNNIYITGGDFNGITHELCAGTYRLVVEGQGSGQGMYELNVTATNATAASVNAGSISGPSGRICAGEDLDQINSSANASSGFIGGIVYRWEKKIGSGPWFAVSGENEAVLENTGQQESDPVSFRRFATVCGVRSNPSNVVTLTAASENVSVGSIRLEGSTNIPPATDPGTIASASNATAATSPTNVFWQQKGVTDISWQAIPGTQGQQAYDPGQLSASTDYRRGVYGGCGDAGDAEFSNVIRITVIQPNGRISGRITSGMVPFEAGVGGVSICATQVESLVGSPAGTQYCTESDQDGSYELIGIYYGSATTNFRVVPSLAGRSFDPGERSLPLSAGSNTATANFRDITSFSLSGKVNQRFADGECFVEGVTVELKRGGILQRATTTDEEGKYAFIAESAGTYELVVSREGRTFEPDSRTLEVTADQQGIDFQDITSQQLSGRILAGCGDYFGKAVITITEAENCFTVKDTTDENGNYSIDLPAKSYNVAVTEVLEVTDGFEALVVLNVLGAGTYATDLRTDDQRLDLTYHRQPVIEILGLPGGPCADFNSAVLQQGNAYPVTINVYEGSLGGCPVDTAMIIITDEISGKANQPDTVRLSGGSIEYLMEVGAPNIVAPHLLGLSIGVTDTLGQSADFTTKALVTGARARENNFTTTTPELPLMILRDPPGDGSYSYLEESETTEVATSFSALAGGSVNVWGNVRVGTEFEAGLGFSTTTKIWGDIRNSLEISATASSLTENILTLTATDRFSTSDSEDITGDEGDVFMGAAMNLIYAITDEVAFDRETCEPVLSKSWMIGNDGFATTYIYTESYILNNTIPGLQSLREQATDPADEMYYADQIKVWQQVLTYNNELKAAAIPVEGLENVSFSNNAPFERETVSSTSKSITIEFNGEVATEVAAELGLEVGGSGISGGVVTKMRMELGSGRTETTLKTLTTGFRLFDNDGGTSPDDPGDGFNVAIKTDPVYNTPVFDVLGGQSSCPHEAGTVPREGVDLSADNFIQANIAAGGTALFNLTAGNISESDEDREYYLRFIPASNPDGAVIKVNGTPYTVPLSTEEISAGSSVSFQVTVEQGATNVSYYQGLEFELYSDCDASISDRVALSAIFQNDCSEINLSAPGDGFIANAALNNQLEFIVKDYELDKLRQITLEVSTRGQNNWQPLGASLEASALSTASVGTQLARDITNLADGEYEFRIKLGCATSTVFSNRVTGLIDRRAPRVLGNTQPFDDNFAERDEISVSFDESISCTNANVEMRDVFANTIIPATFTCLGNKLVVTPTTDLTALAGQPVTVTIVGVSDQNGNEIEEPVSWTFSGGSSATSDDSDGDGVIDARDRCPGADDTQDADNDGIPDNCDPCQDQPTVGLRFDGQDDYAEQNAISGLDSTHTIEAWIYVDETPQRRSSPLTLGQRNNFGHHWLLNQDSTLQIGVWGIAEMQFIKKVVPGRWVHLATVYENRELTLYVDGFKFGTVPARFDFSSTDLILGLSIFAGESNFAGRMDEIRVWNTARTQAEITDGMREELTGEESGLMAYFPINEGVPQGDNETISALHDQSLNGNDASLNGFTRTGASSNWVIGSTIPPLDADDNGFGDLCEPPPTGVDDRFNPAGLKISKLFPNPANSEVNLQFTLVKAETVEVSIVDLMGRVLHTKQETYPASENTVQFATGHLPAGLYLVRAKLSSGQLAIRKLVIE